MTPEAFWDPAVSGNSADELAAQLAISPRAIDEAIRRNLLTFVTHRNAACWRFGDTRNGCFRRLEGEPFVINGQRVKAEAETKGGSWHRLIGLDDVVANDRHQILLTPEGSKDALAALHFADAEDRLSQVGVVAALGAGVKPLPEDIEKIRGRRLRIFGDADAAGQHVVSKLGRQFLCVAEQVQAFNLAGLHCVDGSLVKDLFDLSRVEYDDFEANRDLWSVTDLNSSGERVSIFTRQNEFLLLPPPLPHGSPESLGFPVYPVSSARELEKRLLELAIQNACSARGTARKKRWKLAQDLTAVEKHLGRKLSPGELMATIEKWFTASQPNLDPKTTRDEYCGRFFAELRKVRVPTGEGEALAKALERAARNPAPELPGLPNPPEGWRSLATLHRELALQSANGIYFLSCRDAAKAHHRLNKDSAYAANLALAEIGVIQVMRVGEARPGGKASEFCYLLPL